MSSIAVKGADTGTGVFTIESPATNTDRILTLPDEAGTVVTETGLPALTKTNLNASGDAPVYACRAWVNFEGSGTVAIYASGNVSSITDNGVGDYTVNFTNAMPSISYVVHGTVVQQSGSSIVATFGLRGSSTWTSPSSPTTKTTTACRMLNKGSDGNSYDTSSTYVSVFI